MKSEEENFGLALFGPAFCSDSEQLQHAGIWKKAFDESPHKTRAVVRQRVVALGYGLLKQAGRDKTYAGIHLRRIQSTAPEEWTQHHFDVSDTVGHALVEEGMNLTGEHLNKTANWFTQSAKNIAEATALVSLLTGAALGTLYWKSKRMSGMGSGAGIDILGSRDSAEIAEKEQQLRHFERVGGRLEKKLQSRYNYPQQPYDTRSV